MTNQETKVYRFTFKTPEQAAHVAAHIALLCPHHSHLELGLNEVFLNAIEHGNLGLTGEEKSHLRKLDDWQKMIYQKLKEPNNITKKVTVIVTLTPQADHFEIIDDGNGFDWQNLQYKQPSPKKCHGRGILLASELCFDEIEFIEKGNVIRCLCWKK